MASLPYPDKLAGKRVLVIGGTSGIGFAVAALAVAAGAIVHVSSSNPEKIEKAVSKIQAGYPAQAANITGTAANLGNEDTLEDDVRSLLQRVTKDAPLDHVVFTAGDGLNPVHISDVSIDLLKKGRTVRYFAPIIVAKNLTNPAFLRQAPTSSLTLTSGTNGFKPTRNWSLTASICGAIDYLARGLTVDMAPVRVNAVAPGAIDTEIFDGFGAKRDELIEHFKKQTLTGSIGKPQDIGELYLYIMRDPGMAGKTIESDSGRLLV